MALFRKSLPLGDVLNGYQQAMGEMLTAARDTYINRAQQDANVTTTLPGEPSLLAVTPQDQLLPDKVKLVTESERWNLNGQIIDGQLEITWRLKPAPELTARLRDNELEILDNTLKERKING